ncbi:coiled-coil domain-containing protein [Micromonospora echinofusca]|uniref:PPE family protein n=1 Tax=Micromonospora echinofusca TaxID=47858 RepID=A0ABS3VPR7_MICEH|nr:hypothetical protein [Micromonospora echinofusca]MBO4206505.1 hypothetical protein [Micromonospora echinofusca]
MIERGSGATTDLGGTNWTLLDVPTIWATLADHDTGNHWRLVVGWRRTCELTMTHLGRLTEYRERLVQAWPPERSSAAREYVNRLDHLIESLRQTHDVAAANYDTFSAATTAIGATRTRLRAIHDQYAEKQQQKQEYEENLTRLRTAGMANVRGLRPPVEDDELEKLNIQARELMTGLSGELRQAQAQLRQPPPASQATKYPNNPDVYPNDQPLIPPVIPMPLSQNRSSSGTPAPASNRPGNLFPSASIGPILGSAGTPASSHPVQPAPSAFSPPNTPPSTTGGGAHPVGISASIGLPPASSPVTRAKDLAATSSTNSPASGRSPHSGNIIGGTSGAALSQPSTRTAPEKRINPVGGMIGSGSAGRSIASNNGSQPGTHTNRTTPSNRFDPLPAGASWHPNSSQRESRQQDSVWDRNDPWETAEGVDPIVRHTDKPVRIEPGPAIGLDR